MAKMYGGKPTRWSYIEQFQQLDREWPDLRSQVRSLTLEGKLTLKQYLVDSRVDKDRAYVRVKGILAQARGVESITKYILRFPLKDFVAGYDALKAYTEIARDLVSQATRLPLEESPGYKFNQQYRVTPEEIQYAVENEDSYSNILLDF